MYSNLYPRQLKVKLGAFEEVVIGNEYWAYILEAVQLATPGMEDYLEQIYLHIEAKGVARVSDVAESLAVLPSSVTKMAQRLDKEGYIVYERYKGLELTGKGFSFGKSLCGVMIFLNSFFALLESMKKIFMGTWKELNIT